MRDISIGVWSVAESWVGIYILSILRSSEAGEVYRRVMNMELISSEDIYDQRSS